MNNEAQREMTLDEWVDKLPDIHAAKKELSALRQRLADMELLVRATFSQYSGATIILRNFDDPTMFLFSPSGEREAVGDVEFRLGADSLPIFTDQLRSALTAATKGTA